jgi:glyoxylase-like metal-dependent hydrolase (beta-lactamase superfamily II)
MAAVETLQLDYNSLYLVGDREESVLVDAGPDFDGAEALIRSQLRGRAPDLIAITHGHIDHAGLGQYWESAAIPVAVGSRDLHLTAGPALTIAGEWDVMAGYVEQSGPPADIAAAALQGLEQRRSWAQRAATDNRYHPATRDSRWRTALRYQPFTPSRRLDDGDYLPGGLRVIACPGHTPGNLVLIHEAEGWLFSGDQLLPTITPTPAIQVDVTGEQLTRFHSLPHFVASLQRLQMFDFTRCYPGHGEPFDNVAEVIASCLAQVEQRSQRLLATLREHGAATVYDLAGALYPRALNRRFWQIVATVQGQLDLLEGQGVAICHEHRWSAA